MKQFNISKEKKIKSMWQRYIFLWVVCENVVGRERVKYIKKLILLQIDFYVQKYCCSLIRILYKKINFYYLLDDR